ncbi:phosphate propanoyltransferase [Providencia sp. JGM181]|jgi:putative phosphotransacetylase|uniref:phosphate propanoyltransferase n=1 Tax=unclassified Providencia TaxID=2633465 RepID=UPI001BA4CCA2|nr:MULTISPECIES: phosphate propanoyltransferase [unclassified Providencia]MBS0924876.1 phosphate propanoyltransferase [Providencia sp. JGM181]MBS0933978.1 phosphate propanoyltransferase [Providencia sp. JGM172]MBS0999094.1 phosphate propanoyltransferase [Providencia sp. JGM178]
MINQQLMGKILSRLAMSNPASMIDSPIAIPVGVSNRHVHLSQEDVTALFGEGYQLTPFKDLKQPGQFAAKECVMVVGPKGSISKVRVLGPTRPTTQLEVSKADCFALGIKAPVRESGDLNQSGSALLIGPAGHVNLCEQVICAQRHIHMNLMDARSLNVANGQRVCVRTEGERSLVFDEVVVRVDARFSLEFHIDTDEANAAGLRNSDSVFVVS